MSLVENERTKLLAGSIDRLASICMTVGVAGPAATYLYVDDQNQDLFRLLVFCYFWLVLAGSLHIIARRALGHLKGMTPLSVFVLIVLPLTLLGMAASGSWLNGWLIRRNARPRNAAIKSAEPGRTV